jgi:intracellular septation protein A
MPRVDRLGITVSLVVLGLLLSILVTLPSRTLSFWVFGSQLSLNFSGPVQLAIIMVGLVSAGVDALVRTQPHMHDRSLAYTATFWVLPSVLVVATQVLLRDLSWMGLRLALVGLAGTLLTIVMGAQYLTIESDGWRFRNARLVLNVAVYVAALFLFVTVYTSRVRSILSASSVLLVSGMLALDLFRIPPNKAWRLWLYAGLVALTMGQLTWAMNYVRMDARVGGAFLLLVFYVLTGIIQQYLWRRLTRRMLLEYAFVGLMGMALVSGLARWLLG